MHAKTKKDEHAKINENDVREKCVDFYLNWWNDVRKYKKSDLEMGKW